MTKLQRINELLAKHGNVLRLPEFRQVVSDSGSNLAWLQSRIAGLSNCPEELSSLLKSTNTGNMHKEEQ